MKSFDKFSKGNQKALNNINKNLANLEEGAKTKFPKGDAKQIPMEDMI